MKFKFQSVERWPGASSEQWSNWTWQLRNSLRTQDSIEKLFDLSEQERVFFSQSENSLRYQITPYYASLANRYAIVNKHRQCFFSVSGELTRMIEMSH